MIAYFDGGRGYIYDSIYARINKLTKHRYAYSSIVDRITDKEFAGLDSSCFVGRSKVNFDAGDKFDINIGKILAHDRLLNKYHKLEKRIANKIIDSIKKEDVDTIKRLEMV